MTPEPELPLTGGCMCGKVRFEVAEPLLGSAICHCKRCQRRTGSAFSVTGLTKPGTFSITEGEENVKTYAPEDGFHKSWCAECGGHLFTRHWENPEILAIRMGALDGDPGIRPAAHQYVAYAAPWLAIPDDGLPRFDERLDWAQVLPGAST